MCVCEGCVEVRKLISLPCSSPHLSIQVLFDILEDQESLVGIRSFIGAEYDLRKITETFLGEYFCFVIFLHRECCF